MTEEADQVRVKYIKLTNNGDTLFSDRHDGVPLKVMPGETKNIPLDSAAHMLGYVPGVTDETMSRHICRRQGWNTPQYLETDASGKTLAERNFAKLKIEPVMYRLVQVEADPSLPIAADPAPEEARGPRRVEVRA